MVEQADEWLIEQSVDAKRSDFITVDEAYSVLTCIFERKYSDGSQYDNLNVLKA